MKIKTILVFALTLFAGSAGASATLPAKYDSCVIGGNSISTGLSDWGRFGPISSRPRDRDMIKPPIIPRIPPK